MGILMTTSYTKLSKPTGTSYTKVSGGHILYDDAGTKYDSSAVTYDGLSNMSAYTSITKASGTSYTKIPKAT
jgi:hypothetical protein